MSIPEQRPSDMDPASDSSNPLLMVVDDEPTSLSHLTDILVEYGFDLMIARNGREALARVDRERPDLILLDVLMPEMDGIKTCRRLKADPATATIPILFLSALDRLDDILRGFAAGGVDYLTKPARQEEVLARVTVHLGRKRLSGPLATRLQSLWHEHTASAEDPSGGSEDEQTFLERHAQALERARAILQADLAEPPSLSELARRVGINRNHLNRGFQLLHGLSVFAWVREQRLVEAARRLREGRQSLAVIANAAGYSNTANFITAFKRRFATTPQQYRSCGSGPGPFA